MHITIDNKLYYKQIDIKPINLLSKVWPWALTLGMFVGLAVLGWKCF